VSGIGRALSVLTKQKLWRRGFSPAVYVSTKLRSRPYVS
jgi:hypothetical protein